MIISNLKAIEKMLLKMSGENLDNELAQDFKFICAKLHDVIKCIENFKRDFGRWL